MRHHGMSAMKISNCDAGRNADGEKTSVPTVAKVLLMPVLVPSPPPQQQLPTEMVGMMLRGRSSLVRIIQLLLPPPLSSISPATSSTTTKMKMINLSSKIHPQKNGRQAKK